MSSNIVYHRHEPRADLKKEINYIWFMETEEGEEQETPDLLIPDGYPEIIFVLKGSYRKRPLADSSRVEVVDRSSVVGLQQRSLLVKRVGPVRLIGIKFKPIGFYHCFGEKAIQTAGKTEALEVLEAPWLMDLEQELKTLDSLSPMQSVISEYISRQLVGQSVLPKEMVLDKCINAIIDANGSISLETLAEKVGKGKRQIQRYFREYIGMSPKKFCSLIRFKSVYKQNVLSDSALGHFFDHGYFDQSHYIKDFRAKLGITPSDTLSREFKAQNEIAKKSIRT
ncbi:helix-turn-helix domain-containing protein [Poritiphilus flavus]|uniref:Helix-turn-helix domain-containing protein n=1 Tax=Poritiphilus flavus TaxID=2697053 RepID=A0A6L9EEV8_9FLAO|nr:helix-turn-helix domain-containing protein [Poritiphilus flavus]NAS13304.1 helix-turn-helix domain-containing protein [Poritiphilus flavus]